MLDLIYNIFQTKKRSSNEVLFCQYHTTIHTFLMKKFPLIPSIKGILLKYIDKAIEVNLVYFLTV